MTRGNSVQRLQFSSVYLDFDIPDETQETIQKESHFTYVYRVIQKEGKYCIIAEEEKLWTWIKAHILFPSSYRLENIIQIVNQQLVLLESKYKEMYSNAQSEIKNFAYLLNNRINRAHTKNKERAIQLKFLVPPLCKVQQIIPKKVYQKKLKKIVAATQVFFPYTLQEEHDVLERFFQQFTGINRDQFDIQVYKSVERLYIAFVNAMQIFYQRNMSSIGDIRSGMSGSEQKVNEILCKYFSNANRDKAAKLFKKIKLQTSDKREFIFVKLVILSKLKQGKKDTIVGSPRGLRETILNNSVISHWESWKEHNKTQCHINSKDTHVD